MADITVIKGDALFISGITEFGGSNNMTGWTGEVKLRKQAGPATLGEEIVQLSFSWLDISKGMWNAESVTATNLVALGTYSLYCTFIDTNGRRFTAPPFYVGVVA